MTQCCMWLTFSIFLLFEHILKLKLVDPKKNLKSPTIICCRVGEFAAELDGCLLEQERQPLDNPQI